MLGLCMFCFCLLCDVVEIINTECNNGGNNGVLYGDTEGNILGSICRSRNGVELSAVYNRGWL